MITKRLATLTGLALLAGIIVLLGLPGCGPSPTLSLEGTYARPVESTDFEALHAPVNGDANQHLIFGNLTGVKPAADLPGTLAAFLGRWEGYGFGAPVKKDHKLVLFVREITAGEGTEYIWWGTNLQYPDGIGEVHFRVVPGAKPAIEWQLTTADGSKEVDTFTYDSGKNRLVGWRKLPGNNTSDGPYELTRDQSFYVYKDYTQYLNSKRIYARSYEDGALQRYGQGYLLYLPEGYEADATKTWPLIFFLHGIGERGDNLLLLPKASPFIYIREKGPLPCIIVAPMLSASAEYSNFPDAYVEGVLAEMLASYRVDPKRIYLTGMSMGGIAGYSFALQHPDTFAAMAALTAFVPNADAATMGRIRNLPVWAIHGTDDTVIPLRLAQQTVNALQQAGGNVRFTVLQGYDHDVWTDTYADPEFYDWLLGQ